MSCPKCKKPMHVFKYEGKTPIDMCHDCGIWLRKDQLASLCHSKSDFPNLNKSLTKAAPSSASCTDCQGQIMKEIPYDIKDTLLVDYCESCEGVFLDKSELMRAKKIAKTATFEIAVPVEKKEWYLAEGERALGPMTLTDLRTCLKDKSPEHPVFKKGNDKWMPASSLPDLQIVESKTLNVVPETQKTPRPRQTQKKFSPAYGNHAFDEISYTISGSETQYVEMELDPNEMILAEPGAMMYMTAGVQMESMFGDPSKQKKSGFLDTLMTAGKRLLSGESLTVTTYFNPGRRIERVALAAPFPGKVIPVDLNAVGGEIIAQSKSFLCAARGVQISIAFQKKIMTGLFGGEGFIMQRLYGGGVAMLHAGGNMKEIELAAGERITIDTGCLVAMTKNVKYEVEMVRGVKNIFFAGEGVFVAKLAGPGKVWVQSMPFTRLVGQISQAIPTSTSSKSKGIGIGDVVDLIS